MNGPTAEKPAAAETAACQKRGHSWWIWVLVFIFIVYPLSIGPAMKLCVMGYYSPGIVSTAYAPLRRVIDSSPPLRRLFEWYIDDVWKAYPRSRPILSAPPMSMRVAP